jgi:uncharacterized cupredoxin-like copper-binding protein
MKALVACLACALIAVEVAGAQAHEVSHDHTANIGVPGKTADINRTIQVTMLDSMRFTPSSVVVKEGETIRFVVTNAGKLKHEFVLGTDKELAAHAQMMKKFPDMQHSDPNMITLAAGQTGEVVWRFSTPGKVTFACLQVGHYDAGMKGTVDVRPGIGDGP